MIFSVLHTKRKGRKGEKREGKEKRKKKKKRDLGMETRLRWGR